MPYYESDEFAMFSVVIAMSYFAIIMFARDWVYKRKNLIGLIIFAILLSIIGNYLGFFHYQFENKFGIFNGPIFSLIVYSLLDFIFGKIFNEQLASPMDTLYGNYQYSKHTIFTMIFVFITTFSIPMIGNIT